MPSVIVETNDILKIQAYCFESANKAQVAINTTYWKATVTGGAANAAVIEFATLFDATLAGIYKGLLSTSALYSGFTAQKFRPKPAGLSYKAVAGAGAGTVAGDLLPPQTAFVISFLTLTGSVRGRNYLPFPSAGSMDANGTPSAAYLTQAALLSNFFASPPVITKGMVSTTLTQQVYTPLFPPASSGLPPVRTEAFTTVIDYFQQDGFGTQRRRGYYGRQNPPLS